MEVVRPGGLSAHDRYAALAKLGEVPLLILELVWAASLILYALMLNFIQWESWSGCGRRVEGRKPANRISSPCGRSRASPPEGSVLCFSTERASSTKHALT